MILDRPCPKDFFFFLFRYYKRNSFQKDIVVFYLKKEVKTFSKRQNLDSVKLRESADDNFEFNENRKFTKRVENTMGKGEIARYEQFLLFPRCFQKTLLQTRKNLG